MGCDVGGNNRRTICHQRLEGKIGGSRSRFTTSHISDIYIDFIRTFMIAGSPYKGTFRPVILDQLTVNPDHTRDTGNDTRVCPLK